MLGFAHSQRDLTLTPASLILSPPPPPAVAASERLKAAVAPGATTATPAEVLKAQRLFTALQPVDADLLRLAAFFKDDELAKAVSSASPSKVSAQHKIGVLSWFCAQVRPASLRRFPLYLKAMYDDDALDEAAVAEWHAASAADSAKFLPDGARVTAEEVAQMKESANAFVTWLKEAEDDEDDEDDDEDEE